MLSKKFAVQVWAMMLTGVLFVACSPENPMDFSETAEKTKPNPIPKVVSVIAQPESLTPGHISTITVMVSGNLGDDLSYSWSARGGKISGNGNKAIFIAGNTPDKAYVAVEVRDRRGEITSGFVTIRIE
jgi:hypothetical protein